jgi:hypothetical protein
MSSQRSQYCAAVAGFSPGVVAAALAAVVRGDVDAVLWCGLVEEPLLLWGVSVC